MPDAAVLSLPQLGADPPYCHHYQRLAFDQELALETERERENYTHSLTSRCIKTNSTNHKTYYKGEPDLISVLHNVQTV